MPHNHRAYNWHELQKQSLKFYFNMLSASLSWQVMMLRSAESMGFPMHPVTEHVKNFLDASIEMSERLTRDYVKPAFRIAHTTIDQQDITVKEEIVSEKPFGTLVHFKRDTERNDPKVLIVAPMSGHFATLLRDTVKQLLPHHDVYITDWHDARHVPAHAGDFGFDDYVSYVKDFLKETGPDTHVMAFSQSTVTALAAIAQMAEDRSNLQPLSMILMGGPIDVRAAETDVTRFTKGKSIDWFKKNLITSVPDKYEGRGRLVYPGFMQLSGFMALALEEHVQSHTDLLNHLSKKDHEKADKIKAFYDEYLAVSDLSAKFYLETIEKIFMQNSLANGTLTVAGKKIDLSAIAKTALFTIEGSKDNITAPGQTTPAHDLCANIPLDMHFNHLQQGAGHYDIFSGPHWQKDILPRLTGFIREVAERNGLAHAPLSKGTESIVPQKWKKRKTLPTSKLSRPV